MGILSGLGKIVGGILSIPKDAVQGAVHLVTGNLGKSLQDFEGIVKDPINGIQTGIQDMEQDPLFNALTTAEFGPLPNVVLSASNTLGLRSSENSGGNPSPSNLTSSFNADMSRIFQKIFDFSSQIEKFLKSFLGEP